MVNSIVFMLLTRSLVGLSQVWGISLQFGAKISMSGSVEMAFVLNFLVRGAYLQKQKSPQNSLGADFAGIWAFLTSI